MSRGCPCKRDKINIYVNNDLTSLKQLDRVAMGLPLFPAIAYFGGRILKHLLWKLLSTSPPYTRDMWMIPFCSVTWERTFGRICVLFDSQHRNIKFTIEIEENGCLPFLDSLIIRNQNVTLGHIVYHKPMHTNLYLNNLSNHHPAQKRSVVATGESGSLYCR